MKKKPLPKTYKAPPGSPRAKQLAKATALYKSGKKQAAFDMRGRMEKKVRDGKAKR